MRPRRTPSSNRVYRLKGGNEDNDLWARFGPFEHPGDPSHGADAIRSVWELDDAERAAIAAGANVELAIIGGIQPPVSLAVTDEPLGRAPTDPEARNPSGQTVACRCRHLPYMHDADATLGYRCQVVGCQCAGYVPAKEGGDRG